VICPDLRGYGQSSKPPTTPDHGPYSKRAMAGDIVRLMGHLGHERFAVVGHDRGSYVATRLALDSPRAVTRLAVLDSVPIAEALDRADAPIRHRVVALVLLRPAGQARAGDPRRSGRVVRRRRAVDGRGEPRRFPPRDPRPATVRAMLEDYRAGLGPDRAADAADRAAGRRFECPTLVLWSSRDDLAELYGDVLAVWRPWTTALSGGPIESGHHVAEDAPDVLASRLAGFFAG